MNLIRLLFYFQLLQLSLNYIYNFQATVTKNTLFLKISNDYFNNHTNFRLTNNNTRSIVKSLFYYIIKYDNEFIKNSITDCKYLIKKPSFNCNYLIALDKYSTLSYPDDQIYHLCDFFIYSNNNSICSHRPFINNLYSYNSTTLNKFIPYLNLYSEINMLYKSLLPWNVRPFFNSTNYIIVKNLNFKEFNYKIEYHCFNYRELIFKYIQLIGLRFTYDICASIFDNIKFKFFDHYHFTFENITYIPYHTDTQPYTYSFVDDISDQIKTVYHYFTSRFQSIPYNP